MKEVYGIYLPDHEQHLLKFAGEPGWSYQKHKLEAALGFCKNFRTAVDVGGHCGLWSMNLVNTFAMVHAFEPVEEHRACFERNVKGPHVLYPYALGEEEGSCSIFTSDGSSGDSWVSGSGDIPIKRLDDFDFQDVDFIKLDCEGYELPALKGGEETLKRWQPCVIVEQKPGRAQKFGFKETEAVHYLRGLGAYLRTVISGDFILSWD